MRTSSVTALTEKKPTWRSACSDFCSVSGATQPTAAPAVEFSDPDVPLLSGLKGKAMLVEPEDVPTKGQVRNAVPAHCYVKDTKRSLKYAAGSVVQGLACLALEACLMTVGGTLGTAMIAEMSLLHRLLVRTENGHMVLTAGRSSSWH